jgi:glycosyltransferase involved in cell wall biosynthesis
MNRRPRLLVFMHVAEMSGPARSLEPRLAALSEQYDLIVVVPHEGPVARHYANIASIVQCRLSVARIPRHPWDAVGIARNFAGDYLRARRLLRKFDPEITLIVTTALPAVALAARGRRNATMAYVGELFDKSSKRHGIPRRVIDRTVRRLFESSCADLVCCSTLVADQFSNDRVRVTVIEPSAQVASHVDQALQRARFRIPDAVVCVAAAGTLTRARGQDVLIRAVSIVRQRVPNIHCVIAGVPHENRQDVVFAADLRALAERLELANCVQFLGYVADPVALFQAVDVVVNPARFAEPFGRVGLEAAAAGTPFVSSSVGAVPSIFTNLESAVLVPPESPMELALAIVRVVNDPKLAGRVVSGARREVIPKFDPAAGIARFAEVVARINAGEHAAVTS